MPRGLRPWHEGPTGIPCMGLVMERLGGCRAGHNAVPSELPGGICYVITFLFCLVKRGFYSCCCFADFECRILHKPGFP